MGSCCSSSGGSVDEDAIGGYGGDERRVWPSRSEEDGEWDVDDKATMYIAKFHSHQSGVVCSDCAADHQQQQQQEQEQQAPAATAAQ